MEAPVSIASTPRASPSSASIDKHLTQLLPDVLLNFKNYVAFLARNFNSIV